MTTDTKIAAPYRKDPEDEAFLARLNDWLVQHQEMCYRDLPETYPTLFVIGAPRSGTTLLMQLITSHLRVGYINNLIAAFWKAPEIGIRLSKKLLPLGMASSYQSNFGRTVGINEPHEFGYFWRDLLGEYAMEQPIDPAQDIIDWERVRRVLLNMSHAFGLPVVYKTVQLSWRIEAIARVLPHACFIRIRRDPVQNALSILQYRRTFFGDQEHWGSAKPNAYHWLKNEPYWKQVAGQVYFLEQETSRQIAAIGGRNVLELDYQRLCDTPRQVLDDITALLRANGGDVEHLSTPPDCFSPRQRGTDADLAKVQAAVYEFYGSAASTIDLIGNPKPHPPTLSP
ncbi:conserved hypothetical protein [Gammaproteobacteria bacterium]